MESSMRCIFLFVEDESCNRMCKCSLQQAMYACVYCFALCLCSNYVVFRILDDTKVITSKTDRNSINACVKCVKCEWQSLHKIFIFISWKILQRFRWWSQQPPPPQLLLLLILLLLLLLLSSLSSGTSTMS